MQDYYLTYREEAEETIGDTDPDDVLSIACALASDVDIWSDVIDSFDTL